MQTKSAVRPKASPNALAWWLGGLAVLALGLLVFVVVWLLSFDRTGTYENTTSVADLDGDGDLDVILHNLRHESELAAFGGTTLWINDGQGRFAPRGLGIELPPLPYLGGGRRRGRRRGC